MRYFFLVFLIFYIIVIDSYSQSYKVEYKGYDHRNGYYSPLKSIELRKSDFENYSKNSFFIKPVNSISNYEIEKLVSIVLSNSGYPKFNITKLSRAFEKFIRKDLLSNSNSRIENIYLLQFDNQYDVFELCSLLTEHTEIEYAVPHFFYKLSEFKPNDSEISKQWALEAVDLFKAWDVSKGDRSVVVGIVDSGVDIYHEDLSSQVWINQGEIPNDGIDNDGNGFIDDVNGWDFVGDISHSDAILNNFKEDNNVVPVAQSNDHGTHVAGIAAASTNNNTGIASSGYELTFMPIKIGVDDLNKSRLVYRPYEAMLYAANNGADVINCSWASRIHDPLANDVISEIISRGVLVVAASGNETAYTDNYPYYPANIEGVISVGSINSQLRRSYFSNFGIKVDCYAPGESIYSTINSNRYASKNGTSMASPLVSGIVANLINIFPNYNHDDIAKQIRVTAKPLSSGNIFTYGIINAFDAYRYNNSEYPSYKKGGFGLSNYLIQNNDRISSYGTKRIKLIFKTYFDDVGKVNIKFSGQDSYFKLSPESVTLENLKAGEFYEVELNFTLLESCPWFEGKADIFITYDIDNSRQDYELISIPIELETNNKNLLIHNFMEDVDIQWLDCDAFSKFDFWSVGYDYGIRKGVLYNFGKLNRLINPSSDPIYGISALDDRNIMIVTNSNQSSKLLKSTNSGSSFSTTDLTADYIFLSGVKYINSTNAFVYGLNQQGIESISFSKDAGKSFISSKLGFSFSQNLAESISSKSASKNGIHYLGTDAGKIIFTTNNGENWSLHSNWSNDTILFIAPLNQDSLFVLTKGNSFSIQLTTNGGKTFSKISYNLTDLSKTLQFFVPDGSNAIYVMDKIGKIYHSVDLGKNWNAELNKMYEFYDLHSATTVISDGKVRVWNAGADISYLDFDLQPINILRDLKIAGRDRIIFDTLNIQEFSEDIIFIENKGNVRENIISQNLKINDAFEITEYFKTKVSPSELISSSIKFSPTSIGFHEDTLYITTDLGDTLIYYLSGFAADPSSLNTNEFNSSIKLFPTSNFDYILEISSDEYFEFEVSIYDLLGNIVLNLGAYEHQNFSRLPFNLISLQSGTYFLKVNGVKHNYITKIIILK